MSDLLTSVARGRTFVNAIWVSAIGVLGLYITIRMIAQGADAFGVILIGGVTALVWWRAWILIQRFRASSEASPPQ